jgi:predicted metal-dependent hydrolase
VASPDAAATRESAHLGLLLPDGVPVPLVRVRDRRARRLRLTVNERGVRLSVPLRVPEHVAEAFVQDQLGWIAAQWGRLRDPRGPVEWAFGAVAALPLAGEECVIEWIEARSARIERVAADADAASGAGPDRLRILAPASASAAALRRALAEFYAAEARTAIQRWLPAYLPGLPRPPRAFRVRALSSLWGSLAADGTVSLDLALVLGPPAALEYVLVHEICHLIHANHSPAFWREVEARLPHWREQRAFLRGAAGGRMKGRLRALLGG